MEMEIHGIRDYMQKIEQTLSEHYKLFAFGYTAQFSPDLDYIGSENLEKVTGLEGGDVILENVVGFSTWDNPDLNSQTVELFYNDDQMKLKLNLLSFVLREEFIEDCPDEGIDVYLRSTDFLFQKDGIINELYRGPLQILRLKERERNEKGKYIF